MTRLHHAVLVPALLLGPVLATGAAAANRFDGAWSVVAPTDSGTCTGPYRYPIVIRDGTVDDAGGNGVDASGRADPDGQITGTIRQGVANVSVAGRLRGGHGQRPLDAVRPHSVLGSLDSPPVGLVPAVERDHLRTVRFGSSPTTGRGSGVFPPPDGRHVPLVGPRDRPAERGVG